ncbi:putative mitochondrial chaperone BCS1-B [Mycena venus]|uniref:Putative mitochondrial chaperone BCS1-B n=1 Tax=Mycena venus TaxID=2733690 RepID=A0A8H7D0E6_9AGAR|nr:putative mitochondrial chaperone BCS1-B [Mycena venus]
MNALSSMLSPLGVSTGALQDTLKLVVIGGTMETARRASVSAWNGFVDSFFLTAHFSEEDYPYDWLMHWLSKQPAWGRSREFEITTRSVGRNGEEDEDEDDTLVHGRRKRKVAFQPSIDTTHTIYYRGHWLRITRTKRFPDYGHGADLKISSLCSRQKREYEKDAEHRVHIFMADTTYGCWRWNGARQKRPMSSIVLQPGVKDMLLADCKDFLCSEEWYAERAGELGLDIYVVSLSSKGMSDNTLTTLMGHVPTRCILLLEDLDAAFTRSVSRDASSTGAPTSTTSSTTQTTTAESDGSTLSLSGLLNSLDGVAAAEGRLLFCTTNHLERLDPALSRPGRMDVWVNFTHATKWQAEGIFKCFFPYKPSTVAVASESSATDVSQKNLPLPKRRASTHAIPVLSETEISELAKRFAAAIPEDELSVAALQGYLLKNKTRPRECVDEVDEWVIEQRETREKLAKEKAEKEAKEKKEAEEKEKKEKEEKEAKEARSVTALCKEEKEAKEKLERKEARLKAKKASAASKSDSSVPADSTTESTAAAAAETGATPAADEPSSSSSSSETDTSTGMEADTEESVTSEEEESDKADKPAKEGAKKEKWVAVKSQPPAAAAAAELQPEMTTAEKTATP